MIPELIEIKLHQASRILELIYSDGSRYELSFEHLRVSSPSAETRRSKPINKQGVNIIAIEPVGQYAVKFIFDDGHKTGLYTFEYLYELATGA